MAMSITGYVECGIARARAELGLSPEAGIAAEAVGTVWKYALAAALAEQWGGEAALREFLHAGRITREELAAAAERWLPELAAMRPGLPLPEHLQPRVVLLAVDAVQSERLCPELLFPPAPVTLPARPIHALLFSAFPHVGNELYPLMVDAYTAGAECDVVGIHPDWLAGNSFRRAILFDAQRLALREVDIIGQPEITSASLLALDLRHEHEHHRRLERALPGVRVRNPSAGARKLDNKIWTGRCWQQAHLPTPSFTVLGKGLPLVQAEQMLRDFAGNAAVVVLKPADGTEGRGVVRVSPGAAQTRAVLAPMLRQGDVLIMAEHGSVCYRAAEGILPIALRVHVCWDGEHAHAESGYAQVACAPREIASAGRGGSIAPLAEIWPHLCLRDGTPMPADAAGWHTLRATAEAGVCALAAVLDTAMPALLGIDLLLDSDGAGQLGPLLLEANPRPAGLGHAHWLGPDGPTREPGVSLHLWQNA